MIWEKREENKVGKNTIKEGGRTGNKREEKPKSCITNPLIKIRSHVLNGFKNAIVKKIDKNVI